MQFTFRAGVAAVMLVSTASGVHAQSAGALPAAMEATPASAASSAYRSAFEGYRSFKDQPVGSWRQANDVVGQIGGWQAYAREGQGGPVAGTASAPAASDVGGVANMPGTGGHDMSAMSGMQGQGRGMSAKPNMQMPAAVGRSLSPMSPAASTPGPARAPVKVQPTTPSRRAAGSPVPPGMASGAIPKHKTP